MEKRGRKTHRDASALRLKKNRYRFRLRWHLKAAPPVRIAELDGAEGEH